MTPIVESKTIFDKLKQFLSRLWRRRKIDVTSIVQLNTIFGNLKWIIVCTIVVCVLFCIPEQLQELYRVAAAEDISAAEQGSTALTQLVSVFSLKELLSIFTIAVAVWFAACLLVAETSAALAASLTPGPRFALKITPSVLGAAPILAAAVAQLLSMPERPPFRLPVGSVIRIQKETLEQVGGRLEFNASILLVLALAFACLTWLIYPRAIPIAKKLNDRYFARHRFFVFSVVVIAALTGIVLWRPVDIPQFLGPFVVLAIFMLCILAICVHLSLYTCKYRIPLVALMIIYAALLMALNVNDNHFARRIEGSTKQTRIQAGQAFVEWLKSRPDLNSAGAKAYPVFIISAEGGGIYAAYNAAAFLGRMQDLCPNFDNHVFAISSVSGGSVGAATFVAALDAVPDATKPPTQDGPCPNISRFLTHAQIDDALEERGVVESKTDAVLSKDFLSPLVAALLFPDFSQWFIPKAFGGLDRARALEYTLEQATDGIYEDGGAKNILKNAVQDYWRPDGRLPALLMNATDTGTGKRIVLGPFDVNDNNGCGGSGGGAEADNRIPDSNGSCRTGPAGAAGVNGSDAIGGDAGNDPFESNSCDLLSDTSEQISLSTAAFISARFPWVTPAASTDIVTPCMGWTKRRPVTEARLVDGGYIDNSGTETAFQLMEDIKKAAGQNPPHPFELYVIALSGGDFPRNRAYSFDEVAEPIRALLNGREARSYIDINRGATEFQHPLAMPTSLAKDVASEPPGFNTTKLQNYFYDLPLGWAMSSKTRQIVALESGRYWDCQAGTNFRQTKRYRSNADCVQLEIYNLLNDTASPALDELKQADDIEKAVDKLTPSSASDWAARKDAVLECYERNWWQKPKPSRKAAASPAAKPYLAYYQAAYAEALLDEWQRQLAKHSIEDAVAAYIFGSISYDSDDFRRTTDNLSFSSIASLMKLWPKIEAHNAANQAQTPSEFVADLKSLLHNPEGVAELVWGWAENSYGNNYDQIPAPHKWLGTDNKEGWKFRERGIYQKVGREQYEEANGWLKADDPTFAINLIEQPWAMSNPTVAARVGFLHFFNDPRGRRAINSIKAPSPDFKAARAYQTDMDQINPAQVSDRSETFLQCIRRARSPRPPNWAETLASTCLSRDGLGYGYDICFAATP